jgi:hypothetical protein
MKIDKSETDKYVNALRIALSIGGIELSMEDTEELFMKIGIEIAKNKKILS